MEGKGPIFSSCTTETPSALYISLHCCSKVTATTGYQTAHLLGHKGPIRNKLQMSIFYRKPWGFLSPALLAALNVPNHDNTFDDTRRKKMLISSFKEHLTNKSSFCRKNTFSFLGILHHQREVLVAREDLHPFQTSSLFKFKHSLVHVLILTWVFATKS